MAVQAAAGSADDFVGRLFGAVSAAAEIMTIDLGLRMGYYRALADGVPWSGGEVISEVDVVVHDQLASRRRRTGAGSCSGVAVSSAMEASER